MSTANDVSQAFFLRLQQITRANGFESDIGLRTYRGRRRLGPEQLPCAVLVERPAEKSKQSAATTVGVSKVLILEGHAACDPDNPNDVGHQIIADLKRAIFKEKLVFGAGNQRAYEVEYVGDSIAPREDGLDVVSANLEVRVGYVEDLANP